MVVIVVIRDIVFIKNKYLRSLVIRVIGYTRPSEANWLWWFGSYLNFQEKKSICGAWLLESLGTPDLLKRPGYGGYCGYHCYCGYQEKLFWRSLVICVIGYIQPHWTTLV